MSYSLWKAYYEDDLRAFQRVLEAALSHTKPRGIAALPVTGSPGASSPTGTARVRRSLGAPASAGPLGRVATKADINGRDHTGKTLLHHAVSSTAETALDFAAALIAHPWIDLYLQDYESGWTALHRALYFGNITAAHLMLERDANDALGRSTGHVHQTIGLIKIKDREGFGPLDLYAATIKDRTLRHESLGRHRSGSYDDDEDRVVDDTGDEDGYVKIPFYNANCDQVFTFGSNKNATLGFSNEDDRQFPERINLRRPEHLVRRFYLEHLEQHSQKWSAYDSTSKAKKASHDVAEMWVEDIPWMIRARPLIMQDVQMAKLHSAVLTSDPESNLYLCGHGQGGRLGIGDEQTRYNFVCVDGHALAGKRVVAVALGLNHTVALSSDGEIFSWGNNVHGQLGYNLPKTASSDEDPISTVPRQIFGPLKREIVLGIAASRVHTVAHTGSSLFTFGKNEGQLGIVDSDARSLETQVIPRKVAASLFASNIASVAAMDRATVCLLESHDVWVFANYGYARVQFPLEGFTNYFLQKSFRVTTYDHEQNSICKLTCGGDTVCALSTRGEIFTVSIGQPVENQPSSSTTNPSKIRSAITTPQRIWSPKRTSMAARDVGVDVDGSIILSTEEGSVWKRTKRAKIKDATVARTADYKPKDYKFSRVPGLTRVLAVRASSHGAYAAARRDCDVTKTQIVVEDQTLWKDVMSLLSLRHLLASEVAPGASDEVEQLRYWQGNRAPSEVQRLKRLILDSNDIEEQLKDLEEKTMAQPGAKYDAMLATTTSDVRIPVHRFMLTGRSRVVRRGFRDLCETSTFTIADLAVAEIDADGRAVLKFHGMDILTIIDLVLYLYTDGLIDFWHFTRNVPKMAHRYRQVRTELMKIATKLELRNLEQAARQMVPPRPCLDMDLASAYQDPAFFYDGDLVVQLEDDEIRAHSAFLRARCPFFEGLFMGRAGGRWIAGREEQADLSADLKDINSQTFSMVLRWLYTDCGTELFENLVSVSMDDFIDSVMDVLSAANELLLDRLSQISQAVIGRFVNARNVCGLLNAVSPSSVHEFKDAALEYLCLSLEALVQGHHLNELDEDLLSELDGIVRENQLAFRPFAKSERAELELHERHPNLAEAIDRNRQVRLDALYLRAKYANIDSKDLSASGAEDASPSLQQKSRRKSKTEASRPSLKGKDTTKDMMFSMDEEVESDPQSPTPSPSIRPMSKPDLLDSMPSSLQTEVWHDSRGRILPSPRLDPQTGTPTAGTPRTPRIDEGSRATAIASPPWSLASLPGAKTDMRSIMEQAASVRTSSLSQGLAMRANDSPTTIKTAMAKMSQKDRKRLQHAQQDATTLEADDVRPESASIASSKPASPWQTVPAPRNSPQLNGAGDAAKPTGTRSSSTPHLTMRQTVANSKPDALNNGKQPPAIGPAGQTPGRQQRRDISDPKHHPISSSPETSRSWHPQPSNPSSGNSRPIPHSIRHNSTPFEPEMGLSISEIVAQEQFAKDVVRDAVAKRDLQEIQAEQEFEEWWSKESRRIQEAERRGGDGAGAVPAGAAGGKGGRGKRHRARGGVLGQGGGRGGSREKGKVGGGAAGG